MNMAATQPGQLICNLLEAENDENNNLIQILGIVKPMKSSQTSITALIRGLFTKNKKLVKILDQHTKLLETANDLNDEKQILKSFINEFILWMGDDVLTLFTKFKTCLKTTDLADNGNDATYYGKPILHLHNYIEFIKCASELLRNPYIIGQLRGFRKEAQACLDDYLGFIESSKLLNINFNNVQLFSDSDSSKVCSYFKVTQIVERSRNAHLTLVGKRSVTTELLLVDLNGLAGQNYNSLAVLSVPEENGPRSLLYPPFRRNELSLSYSSSKCQLILRSIALPGSVVSSNKLIIQCPDEDFLAEWVRNLSSIFPLENPNSPISTSFLIKLEEDVPTLNMAGLGINMLSESSASESDLDMHHDVSSSTPSPPAPRMQPFKELIDSPSIQSKDQLQIPMINTTRSNSYSSNTSSTQGLHQPRIPQFVRNSNVSSPTSSFHSVDSHDSYFVPSANGSKSSLAYQPRELSQQSLNIQNIRSGIPIPIQTVDSQERPVSSSAQIEEESIYDKENVDPVQDKLKSPAKVDISNFGKNHNPSFSVHKGLNELTVNTERPKSSFLGMFKKGNRTPKITHPSATPKPSVNKPANNPKSLFIDTNGAPMMHADSDSDTIPLSASSGRSGVSTVSQNNSNRSLTQHNNGSGTAFALPSSTSTYFFKQYKKQNESSTSVNDEDDLLVPQELKDTINDENTIDFYISPSSPKAMKVSKWKAKYGKWEMLTVRENVFVKMVINYELGKSWMLLFKEEFDHEYNEVVDKPMLIMDLSTDTDVKQSSALDVQVFSRNSITGELILIMVRSTTDELTKAIISNIKNIKGVLTPAALKKKSSYGSSMGGSKQTLASSVMEHQGGIASKSSTVTSLTSSLQSTGNMAKTQMASQLTRDLSMVSISSEDINNAAILNNPDNTKLLLLSDMKVRLQEQLEGYDSINNPSSWKILSMFSLNIYIISDQFTEKNYYSFSLESLDSSTDEEYKWLICEEEKLDRIERIGKAGLLVKASNESLFMIECKGKKEFKELYQVF